ncbi:phage distal tail protein [Actinosynnema mirum]|uniref:Siphovirus-type tail component C-terminal domain-containing protein n=1 Tax=Actinosynnema mirum (strain ATCC 29888 / DSM 43827 / JCM 3225 / NBRC 14064 / NCIMB 13271 / NRRL B-12336 / IMRU 3971 / 101) TaxID=446462 RepID=C6WBL1_ACTMD|nr:phage tail domain-containing protein [Actinosynnema mirum]ACU35579.1 hypothetical protein Amir_1630 [Actinosynnema mirum DSM 43827]
MGRQLTWISGASALGGSTSTVLTDRAAGHRVLKGVKNLNVAGVEYLTTEVPGLDGTQVTDLFAPPRVVQLPMEVHGATRMQFLARLRALELALDPAVPGELELMQADGRRFRLRARYLRGLEGSEDQDEGGDGRWARFVLSLYVEDPWWYAAEPIRVPFSYSAGGTFFPILPLVLSSSSINGAATLSNPGTVPSWPVWTATAPGSALTIANSRTGQQISVNGVIPAGRTLTIDTRLGAARVQLDDGTDWWPQLTGTPVFWPVPPGETPISVALVAAGPGSEVVCTWTPRYRSAT